MFKNIEVTQDLLDYIYSHTSSLHPIQKEILQYNKTLGDIQRMQISESQALFLQFVIKFNNITSCLEIGTFTGFSALSMALALPIDGKLVALDKDKEISKVAQSFFKKAKMDNKISTIIEKAEKTLKSLIEVNSIFDLVFIDADKANYTTYFDFAINLVKRNGLIIFDNVLWHGDVAKKNVTDDQTELIRKFNMYIKNDKKTEKTILPIGDGLTICRKL
jgi:predicted O-methyltransferase YrrM|tara:strand:+ start:692 stop:1348 length:657 start_codon:yes stop_codon:yes gene_type:complete